MDICPTQDEIRTQLLSMLPRGRAWGTHDGGPWPGSVLYDFCDVLAATRVFAEERLCALRREFFCATETETNDIWLAQYGLPDACEPYPDLCAKVAAHDGQRCSDLADAAIAAGWAVTCVDEACGSRAGARAGRATAGAGRLVATIVLEVDLANSRAYGTGVFAPPLAGRLRAGRQLACAPDIDGLKCLIARIAPAHAQILYLIGASPTGELDFTQSGNPLLGLL